MRTLEKEMATYSSVLAWRIPMDRGAWLTVHGAAKSQTQLSTHEQMRTYCTAQRTLLRALC